MFAETKAPLSERIHEVFSDHGLSDRNLLPGAALGKGGRVM